MAQSEQYEVWIWGADRWTLKSSWRDLEVGLAAASAHNGPVRIIRALYEDDAVVEKSVIAELRALPKRRPGNPCNGSERADVQQAPPGALVRIRGYWENSASLTSTREGDDLRARSGAIRYAQRGNARPGGCRLERHANCAARTCRKRRTTRGGRLSKVALVCTRNRNSRDR